MPLVDLLKYMSDEGPPSVAKINGLLSELTALFNGGIDEDNFSSTAEFSASQVPDALPLAGGTMTGPILTDSQLVDDTDPVLLEAAVDTYAENQLEQLTARYNISLSVSPGNNVYEIEGSVEIVRGNQIYIAAPEGYSGLDAKATISPMGFGADGGIVSALDSVQIDNISYVADGILITPTSSCAMGDGYVFYFQVSVLWSRRGSIVK